MKKLTIKDIAKEFNVSISTVSKALNDSYEISEATKEKIQKYAKEKNYKPNFNALSLKNRSTKTIGVIIPTMLNYFFAQVFKGIEKTALEEGYKVITCISNQSFDKEVEIIEMLSNGSIDGFLLSMAKETELKNKYDHFKESIENGTPIVMFDTQTLLGLNSIGVSSKWSNHKPKIRPEKLLDGGLTGTNIPFTEPLTKLYTVKEC